jgi:hypothetical protein
MIAPTIMDKIFKICVPSRKNFNDQMHYELLFILQTQKMKSWLLILGAGIMLLNPPASLACDTSKYFNISQ